MRNTNPFEGLDTFSINAIQSKSRRLAGQVNFALSDIDDIEVELALHLRQQLHKYNPERGGIRTFVSRILDNRIMVMIAERRTRHFNYQSISLDAESSQSDGDLSVAEAMGEQDSPASAYLSATEFADQAELRSDLEKALRILTPEQLDLCNRLSAMQSIAEIARETGVSRDTVYERKRQVRRVFERFGLEAYLGR
jgi:RNA polymerase sigma factor (sigma-70 family)